LVQLYGGMIKVESKVGDPLTPICIASIHTSIANYSLAFYDGGEFDRLTTCTDTSKEMLSTI
jgi:hypothetical protein